MATSYLGVNIPKFTGELRWDPTVGEAGGDVFITPAQQLQEWQAEQDRRAALTPAQQAIEDARYIENLEGGVETRYNPVKYGGKEYMVGPSGDMLISLADDQSGLSGKQYRTEILDPITGQKSFQVTEDKGLWKRFLQDLPKIATGVGFVLGLPTFLESAGSALSSLGGSAGAGAGAADLAFLEANAGALAPGAEVAAAGSNAGLASLSGNLASNLTVGEALSTISNPYSIITKPVTQTVYDYLVNTALKDVALSAGEKAVIKTAVGSIVNYSVAELTAGNGEQAFIGTWIGTAMNALPIPGSAEAFGLKQDATFNQLISNLSTKALDVTGISDYLSSLNFTDKATAQILREFGELGINTDVENVPNRVILERAAKLSDQLVSTVTQSLANGISSGVKVIAAGGDAQQAGTAVVLSTAGTLLGGTKIPGTSLTGNQLVDNVEFDVDSFADDPSITGGSGNDASVLVNAASGALDSILGGAGNDFSVIDYLGTGKSTDATGSKKDSISAGSGADTAKPTREDINKAYVEVLGRAGDDAGLDYWLSTGAGLDDIINALRGSNEYKAKNQSITGGGGNSQVSVTGARDSIDDTISDYIDLGGYNDLITSGSSNDSINAGTVEVTGASDPCENPNQIRDPITGGCYDPIDYIVLGDTSVTGGSGNDTIDAGKVTVTAADCNKIGMDYDPIENKCVERVDISGLSTFKPKTPTPPPATSTKVVDTFCKPPKIRDNVNGGCVCPPGTTEQNGECKPSVEVRACRVIGQIRDAEGNCVCPPGQVVIDDPLYGSMCGTPEDTVGESITGGGRNDTIGGGLNCEYPKVPNAAGTACVCPEGTTEQNGKCQPSLEVTAKKCDDDQYKGADGNCYCLDPTQAPNALGKCEDTTPVIIDVFPCPIEGQERNSAGDCVCPPGTTEQNGECKPSVKVEACPVVGQERNAAGNCVCPPGQVVVNDTVSGGQICSTPETTITGGDGNDTITDNKCPAGYFRNSKGECEVELAGLPSLFKNLTLGGDGPASYTPNLTQPFTAARTYKAPPETYDYAGADTVGYEDPYFQRFGPITYTPPTGYLGAGVLPSPAGGTDTDTVSGAGVDTSGGGFAYGGLLSLARGGRTLPPRYLGGITDGMADRVPAHIDGKRPAALSDGEFVIPADVVSHLGNGNSSAGAKMLYEMMDRVRKARTGTKKQGREIDAERFMPR